MNGAGVTSENREISRVIIVVPYTQDVKTRTMAAAPNFKLYRMHNVPIYLTASGLNLW